MESAGPEQKPFLWILFTEFTRLLPSRNPSNDSALYPLLGGVRMRTDVGQEETGRIVRPEMIKPLASKKKTRTARLAVSAVAVVAAAVAILFWLSGKERLHVVRDYTVAVVERGAFSLSTEASGSVVFPIQITVVSPQEGYADTLLAGVGDSVTTKDILAVIDTPDLEDERDDRSAELAQARIALEEIALDYAYSIGNADLTVARLSADVAEAEEEAARLKNLSELKSSRRQEYEDALDALTELREELTDAETQREYLRAQRDLALRKQRAVIDQLEITLARIERDLDEARITSPIPGEILDLSEELSVPGSLIEKNDALFVVADRSQPYVDLDVYEQYGDDLEVGTEISLSIGSVATRAVITSVGKVATLSSDGLSAMITVRAKPLKELTLTSGASVAAVIPLGVREDTLILPRGAYLTTGGQKYVYRIEGDRARRTVVTFGELQGTQVEILHGLSEGDRVITSGYQEYIDQELVELK